MNQRFVDQLLDKVGRRFGQVGQGVNQFFKRVANGLALARPARQFKRPRARL